jgi:hypothetical protein
MFLVAAIMLLIGVADAVTHTSNIVRRTGWMGEPGRLTVTSCVREQTSRGSVYYDCSGEFVSDRGDVVRILTELDSQPNNPYPFGKVLRVSYNGRTTASPIGFHYVAGALARFTFLGLGFGGIGVMVLGPVLMGRDGRRRRLAGFVFAVGLVTALAGFALGLLFAIATLF